MNRHHRFVFLMKLINASNFIGKKKEGRGQIFLHIERIVFLYSFNFSVVGY